MEGDLTPRQRQYIRKHTRPRDLDPSEMVGELNIIPFLDIVVNLIMFLLMTTAAIAFFAQIEARLPDSGRGIGKRGANDKPPLNLTLMMTDNGMIVSASGGKLAPGCDSTAVGRVITIPKTVQGQYDWSALVQCVQKIKNKYKDEEKIIVGADPLVEYQHIVRAMDSVRIQGEKELFPDVLLSAGLR